MLDASLSRNAGVRSGGQSRIGCTMRAIWKGSISFGLVNIPIALYPATKSEELHFSLLRKSDLSPINFRRVAQLDGKEVPWEEIVKGYEYEKGKFVVLRDDDFKRVDIEATQSVEIVDFVELAEVNPMHFQKPYYMEAGKGADKAYALLKEALEKSGKVGIAKVVIRTRQHLASVKPNGDFLVLELMHFADEIVTPDALKKPAAGKPGAKELEMATALIGSLTRPWDPQRYEDDYRVAMLKIIDEKVAAGGKDVPQLAGKSGGKPATNVIDLVSVLQQSLDQATASKGAKKEKPKPTAKAPRKKAA
jgi:DNA end-binding protein Ku